MPLSIAFVLSLAFHLALYTLADWLGLRAPPSPPPGAPTIEAQLRPALPPLPPELAGPPPELAGPLQEAPPESLPMAAVTPPAANPLPTPPPAEPPPPSAAPPALPRAAMVRRSPPRRDPTPHYYPDVAVLHGLEGEALVGVSTDGDGKVVAVRLQRGSGYAILDAAALDAARSLKGLPANAADAPLPVRFRLR